MPKKIVLTEAQEQKIFDMYQNNYNISDIAKHLNIGTKPVCRILTNKYNITDFMRLAKVGDVIKGWKIVKIYTKNDKHQKRTMAIVESTDPQYPSVRDVPLTYVTNKKIRSASYEKVYNPWNKSHDESKARLYRIWASMIDRTRNKDRLKHTNYYKYNIQCCEDWQKYENFRKWSMDNGYDDTLSLDRIDPTGNYCPENCRWATRDVQNSNKIGFNQTLYKAFGEEKTIYEWSKDSRCVVYQPTLKTRIGAGWDIEKAITQPSSRKSKLNLKNWLELNYPKIYEEYQQLVSPVGTIS